MKFQYLLQQINFFVKTIKKQLKLTHQFRINIKDGTISINFSKNKTMNERKFLKFMNS